MTSADSNDDERLIQETLAGNDEAFSSLVQRYKGKVFGMAARFTRNHHELDDLCQDIFIRIYQNLSKFRKEAPFEHWLSKISIRSCYDFLRKHRRDRENFSLDDTSPTLERLASQENPDHAEATELLHHLLNKLSPEERLVITLLEIDGKSVREIAKATGWSESNVKVRTFRARNSLKQIIEKSHEQFR
jgi:RNA polymerase sigma-70 factor (ECF subfamily)